MEENIAESQTTGDEGEEIWAEPNDRVDETENAIEEVNKNFIFLFRQQASSLSLFSCYDKISMYKF